MGRKKKTTHTSGLLRKRVTIGHDKNGKPINPPIYARTEAELEQKVGLARMQAGMGVAVTDKKSTWAYWSSMWKKLCYPKMGKSTKDMYNAALKHLASWDGIPISKLRPIDLSAIAEQMFTDGYSKRTIKSVISAARQVSKLARKNHAMMLDLSDDVKPEKDAPVEEVKPISPEEETLLWNVRPLPAETEADAYRAKRLPLIRMLALAQLNCGLRKEEAVALKWGKNIDIKKSILRISNAYSYADKKEKGPKTESGYREIPIPAAYLEELKSWKAQNAGTLFGRKYVFPGRNGIITQHEFERLWDTLIDAINGITVRKRISVGRKKKGPKEPILLKHNFDSRQLRHTFATNCEARGIGPKMIQYMMGHATFQMTLHYTHYSQAEWDSARAKLNSQAESASSPEKGEADGKNSTQSGQ